MSDTSLQLILDFCCEKYESETLRSENRAVKKLTQQKKKKKTTLIHTAACQQFKYDKKKSDCHLVSEGIGIKELEIGLEQHTCHSNDWF